VARLIARLGRKGLCQFVTWKSDPGWKSITWTDRSALLSPTRRTFQPPGAMASEPVGFRRRSATTCP
jgi:hypothetical protein